MERQSLLRDLCWKLIDGIDLRLQRKAFVLCDFAEKKQPTPARQNRRVSRPASLEASLVTVVILPPLRQMEDAEVSRALGRLKHQAGEHVDRWVDSPFCRWFILKLRLLRYIVVCQIYTGEAIVSV